MTSTYLSLLLLGGAAMAAMMLALWIVERASGDAGVVDVGWAAGLGILAVGYAALGAGAPAHRVLIAVLAGVWSARLAIYLLFNRVLRGPEDGRYQALREKFGPRVGSFFFWFFQAQGVLDVVLSVPFLLICFNPSPGLHAVEYAGAALWLTAIGGESLADRQLARFRADPANRGKTCRIGLWRYSRHPNYFFEWLIWCSYALIASAAPFGWLGVISPAIILYLVLFVTGIPPTEAHALRSRGEDYRDYQRTTSAFVPWFPRRGRAAHD